MKLLLEKHKDLNILVASGPITAENFQVLRAGIRKLFSEGKNKIILDLPDSNTFTAEILREFAVMNLIASELSGQLVLSSIEPLTRAKITSFAKPPVLHCFVTRDDAIAHFYPADRNATPVPVSTDGEHPVAPTDPRPQPAPAPAHPPHGHTEDQQKSYKADIRTKELGDVGSLRKRISELEAQNEELMHQLTRLVVARRDPPELEAWREKVELLEKQLSESLAAQNAAPAGKK